MRYKPLTLRFLHTRHVQMGIIKRIQDEVRFGPPGGRGGYGPPPPYMAPYGGGGGGYGGGYGPPSYPPRYDDRYDRGRGGYDDRYGGGDRYGSRDRGAISAALIRSCSLDQCSFNHILDRPDLSGWQVLQHMSTMKPCIL